MIAPLIYFYYAQGNENDILSQAMKLSFIDQDIDCSIIQDSGNMMYSSLLTVPSLCKFSFFYTDIELKDASSTIAEGKQKEVESARSSLQSKKKSICIATYI